MQTAFILICFVVGCLYIGIGGFLLFFSPHRYVRFLNAFVIVGEKAKVDPGRYSKGIRIVGLILGIFSCFALALPIYWYFGRKGANRIQPPASANTDGEYGCGIWIGVFFLAAFSLFMLVRPIAFLRWATRHSPYVVDHDFKSRKGLLWVRVVAGLILILCAFTVVRLLQ